MKNYHEQPIDYKRMWSGNNIHVDANVFLAFLIPNYVKNINKKTNISAYTNNNKPWQTTKI